MIRSELVQRVADKSLHLHRSDVEKVVNAVLEEIQAALARGNRIEPRLWRLHRENAVRPAGSKSQRPEPWSACRRRCMLRSGRERKCNVVSIRILIRKGCNNASCVKNLDWSGLMPIGAVKFCCGSEPTIVDHMAPPATPPWDEQLCR
jgi:hypothetical protein